MEQLSTAARLAPVLEQIRQLQQKKNRVVIGIDGNCASGKTTMAAFLAEQIGAGVVHMDDFFLPNELRTPQRLAQAGGNVHYERFLQEVLPFLPQQQPFCYRKFSCALRDYQGECAVPAASVIVVEGAYSLHPKFGQVYDLRVLSAVEPALQQRRILARNGAEGWERFKTMWIPMENQYLSAFGIADGCDIIL